jgi:cell shape-determining protein MreC
MKSLRVFFIGVGAIIVIALIIGYRGTMSDLLRGGRGTLIGSFDPAFSFSAFEELRTEVTELRAQLALMTSGSSSPSFPSFSYDEVATYARYPLNDRERIIIDRGSEGGLATGTPVFAAPNVLLGIVTSVARTRAEVQTIFDPGWKSSVAIGTSSARALLSGGNPLRLSLIAETTRIGEGDAVTNAAPEYPLGAIVGTVRAITTDTSDVWRSATIDVPYHTELLTHVLIPRDFP